MSRIFERIGGIARLRITGASPEAFLNSCAFAGIELWGLECIDECCIEVSAKEGSLEAIRSLCLKSMCEVAVISIRGGSRWHRLARKRFALITAAAVSALLLLISSLFIWDIDIEGNESISDGELMNRLAEEGLVCGRYWPDLPLESVRSNVLCREPEIAWLAINISGSRAVVSVEERTPKPEIYAESAPADIVAAHSGVIRRMSILNGKTVVTSGQTVLTGDILVSGTMESITGEARKVRAMADVQAETWRELSAVCPAEAPGKGEILKRKTRFALKLGRKRINFYFGSGKDIDVCDKIINEYKLGIKGIFTLPISIVRECLEFREASPAVCRTARELEAELTARLEGIINGEVLSTAFSEAEKDGLLIVTMRAHCLENIAETAEISVSEGITNDRENN